MRSVKSWAEVNGICVVKALLLELNELKLDILEVSLFEEPDWHAGIAQTLPLKVKKLLLVTRMNTR